MGLSPFWGVSRPDHPFSHSALWNTIVLENALNRNNNVHDCIVSHPVAFFYLSNSELHFCRSESRRRSCPSLSQWALLIATSCRTHRDPALSDSAGEILKFRSVVTLHWSRCWQCSLPHVQWVFLHEWQKSRVHRSSLHHCCGCDWMNEERWHKAVTSASSAMHPIEKRGFVMAPAGYAVHAEQLKVIWPIFFPLFIVMWIPI